MGLRLDLSGPPVDRSKRRQTSPDRMWNAMTPRLHMSQAGSAITPATSCPSPAMSCSPTSLCQNPAVLCSNLSLLNPRKLHQSAQGNSQLAVFHTFLHPLLLLGPWLFVLAHPLVAYANAAEPKACMRVLTRRTCQAANALAKWQ